MNEAIATAPTTPAIARGTFQRSAPPPPSSGATARAVIYLRVSTASQVHTDRDAEGFSIPAQREACWRKAEALGATVVEEYVDAGESARSSDRPALQRMLQRLTSDRDIDLVIVHKVDRLARNRADDVAINLAIRESGAALVSVTENIDETPSGTLLHGIMSSIAEFYSKNLAAEVSKGMAQKARKGGLPTRAPIGYLNAREIVDGNEIRTVVVDPERAPHVRWAFETYAAGQHSLRMLTAELAERGLTSVPTRRTPAQPLKLASVHRLLKNPAYVGFVDFKGERFPGRHEPLVSSETWDAVQDLLDSRNQSGERFREHRHYLKGTIYCARCQRRLCFTRARGKMGQYYDYFFCLGRQGGNGCDLPWLQVGAVEERISELHQEITYSQAEADQTKAELSAAMRKLVGHREKDASSQRKRVDQLEAERRRLLRAHLQGAVPVELLQEEQTRIGRELVEAGRRIDECSAEWEKIEAGLTGVLAMLANAGSAYLDAGANARRFMNQAVFEAIYVDIEGIRYTRLAGAYEYLADAPPEPPVDGQAKEPRPRCRGRGSSKTHLVELMGLEPTTPCLQSRCSSQLSYSPGSGSRADGTPRSGSRGSVRG
jgi:site-specific DNA recombinase